MDRTELWIRDENELFRLNGYERFEMKAHETAGGPFLVRGWRRTATGEVGSSNFGVWDVLKSFNHEVMAKGFLTKIARAINAGM